jgi:hypothetical protein
MSPSRRIFSSSGESRSRLQIIRFRNAVSNNLSHLLRYKKFHLLQVIINNVADPNNFDAATAMMRLWPPFPWLIKCTIKKNTHFDAALASAREIISVA